MDSQDSKTEQAKDQAKHVAGVATDEAKSVAGDVREQARGLLDETKSQVQDQSRTQRDRLVETLRTFSDDLDGMAEQRGGMASDAAREVANRARSFTQQLDGREPAELLDDLRSFARRRPGMFLAGAAIAGVVVGRVLRGTRDAAQGSTSSGNALRRRGHAGASDDAGLRRHGHRDHPGVLRRAGRHAVGVPAGRPRGDLDRDGSPVRGLLMTSYDATARGATARGRPR